MRLRRTIFLLLPALAACASPPKQAAAPAPPPEPCLQTGTASWYRPAATGHTTASGATTSSGGLTAAHRTLPFGTQVLVTDIASGQSVVVRIADRGPFTKGRIIDLSPAAARQLGMRDDGTAQVRLEIFHPQSGTAAVQSASTTDEACPFHDGAA